MEPLIQHYKQATTLTALDEAAKQQLGVLEGQLAWMVSIVGSVIKGRLSSSSSSAESQESIDGELSGRIFGLLALMDTGEREGRISEDTYMYGTGSGMRSHQFGDNAVITWTL